MTPVALSHTDRLTRLTALIAQWQPVWRPLPFQHREPPWAARFQEQIAVLLALSDADCDRLQADPFQNTPLSRWLPVRALADLVDLPELAATPTLLPEAWSQQVAGRKWQQIVAFVPRVQVAPGQPLVEWCAGKGHLARTLARFHQTGVTALEWQGALRAEGQALADRQGIPVRLEAQDVLAPGTEHWLAGRAQVAALHACGDLHQRLLTLAVQTGCSITLAPCCYQRTVDERYRPLSRLGRELAVAQALTLTREDLALAVQDDVTAPRHVRRKRRRASAWRLGFDLLQRELRGVDDYLPVPSLAYGRLPDGFEAFCRWAAAEKGLELPARSDWPGLEQAGWRRHGEVARLELVRHLFRRPLEVWLALDRLHFLEEAGFHVELGTFCPRELTPRNLLLRASPPKGHRSAAG
jgi:hypothetical protein